MRRFFAPPECWGEAIVLSDAELHHALRVLRLRAGDSIVVFDGLGRESDAELTQVGDAWSAKKVGLERRETRQRRLILGQALIRGSHFDQILQHTTELGVDEIVPLRTRRTIVQIGPREEGARLERWRRVVLEATKQCRRVQPPLVHTISRLHDFFRSIQLDGGRKRGFIADEAGRGLSVGQIVRQEAPPELLVVVVGPEGGFEQQEILESLEQKFEPLHLGPTILRAETAAIGLCAIFQHVWQDREWRDSS